MAAKSVRKGKVSFDLSGLDNIAKKMYDTAVENKTRLLILYAENMLRKAYSESTYNDDTYNLKDSYVWGVYFNGRRVKYGFVDQSPDATEPIRKTGTNEYIYGREEAQRFIDGYTPRISNGWEVIFAAAIYYGNYLEMTGTARQKQFVVLSSIFDDLRSDFGSSNVKIEQNVYSYMPKGF